MDGAQGADLVELLDPRVTVPAHQDDCTVFGSPLSDFTAQWQRRGLPGHLRTIGPRAGAPVSCISPQRDAGPARTFRRRRD